MEPGFYWKKDIKEIPEVAVEVTEDIVFMPKYVEIFKSYTSPRIEDFFKFAGIRFFLTKHGVFNRLGFSTQVPARHVYLLDQEIKGLKFDFRDKLEVASDISIFDSFSPLEYAFVESLARHNYIVYDGYFKSKPALFRGIFHKMVQCKVNKRKIVSRAVLENPDLLNMLTKPQRVYVNV